MTLAPANKIAFFAYAVIQMLIWARTFICYRKSNNSAEKRTIMLELLIYSISASYIYDKVIQLISKWGTV